MIKVWSRFDHINLDLQVAIFKLVCFCLHNSEDILIGQFPSKFVKGFRKIGWISIPSKSIKVFDKVVNAGLHDQRTL